MGERIGAPVVAHGDQQESTRGKCEPQVCSSSSSNLLILVQADGDYSFTHTWLQGKTALQGWAAKARKSTTEIGDARLREDDDAMMRTYKWRSRR